MINGNYIREGLTLSGEPEQMTEGLWQAVRESHSAQVSAGWWTDLLTGLKKTRDTLELFSLIHSELSEALEAHRKGDRMDDKLPHRRGVEVELADCSIRLFDFLGSRGEGAPYLFAEKVVDLATRQVVDVVTQTDNFGRKIAILHARVCIAGQMFDVDADDEGVNVSAHLFLGVFSVARERELDLCGAYLEKTKFNAARLDHKIEHRRGQEGKAY